MPQLASANNTCFESESVICISCLGHHENVCDCEKTMKVFDDPGISPDSIVCVKVAPSSANTSSLPSYVVIVLKEKISSSSAVEMMHENNL